NMGNITNNPFLYYLPPESDPEFEAKYERQVEAATTAMKRGVQKGNLLAFGSPASSRMAGLIETAFETVPDGTLKDVRIVFIGDAADNARVMTVVKPTGADYVFVEAKWPSRARPRRRGRAPAGGSPRARGAGARRHPHDPDRCAMSLKINEL